jgi:transposase-like protein
MSQIFSGIIFFLLISLNSFGQEKCPSCNSSMIFTGESKTENGRLFYNYKCPSSHTWWINPKSKTNKNSTSPICPICETTTFFTGETTTENGILFKTYKCASGHKSIGKY